CSNALASACTATFSSGIGAAQPRVKQARTRMTPIFVVSPRASQGPPAHLLRRRICNLAAWPHFIKRGNYLKILDSVTTAPESLHGVSAREKKSSDSGKMNPHEHRIMRQFRLDIRDLAQIVNNRVVLRFAGKPQG